MYKVTLGLEIWISRPLFDSGSHMTPLWALPHHRARNALISSRYLPKFWPLQPFLRVRPSLWSHKDVYVTTNSGVITLDLCVTRRRPVADTKTQHDPLFIVFWLIYPSNDIFHHMMKLYDVVRGIAQGTLENRVVKLSPHVQSDSGTWNLHFSINIWPGESCIWHLCEHFHTTARAMRPFLVVICSNFDLYSPFYARDRFCGHTKTSTWQLTQE